MNNKINLVFPIAGKGERFGTVFKPFLKIGDITFIEKTLTSFGDLKNFNIFFICTQQQEAEFNVQGNFEKFLKKDSFNLIKIPTQTSGPCETIYEALKIEKISGKTIICDCDHYLNAKNIIELLSTEKYDIVIPEYDISEKEYKNWSKLVFKNNNLIKIVEKEFIDSREYTYKGIVGCIGFKNFEKICVNKNFKYVSEYLNYVLHNNGKIISTHAINCLFYGDVPMYEKTVDILRSKMTFFCDIDGVLIKHANHSNCIPEENILINGAEKIKEFHNLGHRIILTTARNKKYKNDLIKLLEIKDIPFDDIVMGCEAGQRVLINDRKPSKIFLPQANTFEVIRDAGLKDFDISNINSEFHTRVIKKMQGNSFAQTYLLENVDKKIIRKHILKTKENKIHYEKLKRQYQDLKRFEFLNSDIVPMTINEFDSNFEYFFDIDYLENYKNLSSFSDEEKIASLNGLSNILNKDIYSLKKEINGKEWMNSFLNIKIYPKFISYEKIDNIFNYLINSNKIKINGKEYAGLREIFSKLDLQIFYPKFISPIHGDLSLENIMFDGRNTKIIDMDGSNIFDAPEHDLGKISQSILSRYHIWDKMENLVIDNGPDNFECVPHFFDLPQDKIFYEINSNWEKILNKNEVLENAIFYMSCYFIRFVPFRLQKNKNHGYFALIMSIIWLNKLLEKKE